MEISLFRNLIFNWAGLVLTVLVGFFLSPYIVHTLGPEKYGIWAVLVAITSQLIVFDFGLRHALIKFLAANRSNESESERYISSAYFVLLVIAISGFLLFWLLTPWLFALLDIPAEYTGVARITFLLLVLDAATDLVMGTYHGILAGKERWDYINATQVVRIVLYAIFAFLLLEFGWGLVGVALATFLSRMVYRCILKWFDRKLSPGRRLSFSLIDRKHLETLLSYGTWVFLMTVGLRVIYNIDTIVVGAYLTPTDVTVYAVALIVVDYFRMLLQSSSALLLPRLSALESTERAGEASDLVLTWAKLSTLFSAGIGLGIYQHAESFLVLWMGSEYQFSAALLSLLILSYFFTVPALGCQQYLLATARHRSLAKLFIFEAAANFVLSVILIRNYGLLGVALGTVLPAVVCRGLVLPLLTATGLGFSFSRYCFEAFLKPLPLLAIYWIILRIDFIVVENWGSFVMANGGIFLVYCLLYLFLVMNKEERSYLRRRVAGSASR